jgi:hypothetical protein
MHLTSQATIPTTVLVIRYAFEDVRIGPSGIESARDEDSLYSEPQNPES